MEILRFENAPARKARKKSSTKTLLGLSAVAAVAVFGSTLAANISLNSGGTVEFGQGVSQTTACDSDGITVTPATTFANSSGSGQFNFSSVGLSGVAAACSGKLLTLQAYGDSNATALNLVSTTNAATIAWSATVASRSTTAGMTLSGSATDATTLAFGTPASTAGAVWKLTLQSQ